MTSINDLIESGILEMYVLGHATPEEVALVERETALHEEVRKEIEAISVSLENMPKATLLPPTPL